MNGRGTLAARGKSHLGQERPFARQLFVRETHRISPDSPPFRCLDLARNAAPLTAKHFHHGLLGTIVGLALLTAGCISLLGPEDVRFRLSLTQGLGLDREFAIGVDGLTAGMVAGLADTKIPLKGLSWVDVGMYTIRGDGRDLVANAELPGWEPIVRVREGSEEVKVFVKQNTRSVKGLVALVREDDELIIVRVKGRIGKLLEALLEDGAIDGFDLNEVLQNGSEPRVLSTPEDVRKALERQG